MIERCGRVGTKRLTLPVGDVMAGDTRKIRVAVLGGGCGALAAAFELTATPELRDRYEVTVYQQGWRLGGKGASGRNIAMGGRIEEHGLHMWLGFYENAFALIRRCFAEWRKGPDNPFQDWTEAFTPQPEISLGERVEDGGATHWETWTIPLPLLPGLPGDGGHFSLEATVAALVRWLLDRHGEAHPHPVLQRAEAALRKAAGALPLGDRHPGDVAALRGHVAQGHEAIGALEPGGEWLVQLIKIGWAVFKGLVEDVLPYGDDGFLRIDGRDFRAWLDEHGLDQEGLDSGAVKALYDLGFAYRDGDPAQPLAGAGVALYVMLNMMFGSRGAPIFHMNAGMGDTIFAPLYEVLAERGVAFAFFHRVTALRLSPDGALVSGIELSRQVDLVGDRYDPLVPVPFGQGKVLPCWPSEPDWTQIGDGAAIRDRLAAEQLTLENIWCRQEVGTVTLHLGREFDLVVLGISLAGLRGTCDELIAADPAFAAMVGGVATVQTQAIQLWLNRDTAGMGWDEGPTVLTAYADPLSTWADMSHLLKAENWGPGGPKSIAYFCGPLSDAATASCLTRPSPPACAAQVVALGGRDWLDKKAATFWPAAVGRGGFDWGVLFGGSGGDAAGSDRLASQYVRANIDPTERYVLSLPGTVQHRLDAGASGFANLYLAGDWVRTRMNSGCVEGAVEGGMRAAQAISGFPRVIFGANRQG